MKTSEGLYPQTTPILSTGSTGAWVLLTLPYVFYIPTLKLKQMVIVLSMFAVWLWVPYMYLYSSAELDLSIFTLPIPPFSCCVYNILWHKYVIVLLIILISFRLFPAWFFCLFYFLFYICWIECYFFLFPGGVSGLLHYDTSRVVSICFVVCIYRTHKEV